MTGGRARCRQTCARLIALATLAWCAPLAGQDPTLYESERLARVTQARGYRVATAPEGRRIAFVEVAREDVLTEDEPWPTWPNALHWLTQEDVVRRELLLDVDDAYVEERVQESMRNLRALGIFALVRIVAVEGPDPQSVGLLVYTRDLWSLRLEMGFSGTGEAFQSTVQLTERNLFGRDKQATVRLDIDPKAFSVGEVYADGRFAGEKLSFAESFDLIINRDSGEPEGSQGGLSFGRPFYDLSERWSWGLSASYSVFVRRLLQGADVVSFRESDEGPLEVCEEPGPECVRGVWASRSYGGSGSVTYRRGERYKQSFTLGFGGSDLEVEAHEETRLRPEQEELFEQELLPIARTQVFPSLSYGLSLPRYVVFQNLRTFGQSESVRVGPAISASFAFPLAALGSSSSGMTFSYGAGYVWAPSDALLDASVGAGARLEDGRVSDQSISAQLRGATPPWLLGRLVGRLSWFGQREDTSRAQVTLGGSTLRGYESGAFRVISGNSIRGNLEYRTLPVDIWSVHLGGVLFYDAGSVYASVDDVAMHHAAGLGFRLLFPQFNRSVFRFDFGVPLDDEGFRIVVGYGSSQAVSLGEATAGGGIRPR